MAGSLSYKGDNKWLLRVSCGYTATGKQRRITKTIKAKSKKEAEKQLALFYLETTGKLVVDNQITFSEFVEYWRIRHSKRVGAITMERYMQMLESRILPVFGKKKLDKITDEHILQFMLSLESKNQRLDNRKEEYLSSVTIHKHFKLLQFIFNKACQWKYLGNNPCKDVPKDMLPIMESESYTIWNKENLKEFLAILDNEQVTLGTVKNKLIFYIALTTGARRGETLGLTWDCVDLENKIIKIEKSMKYVNGREPFSDKPKTKASRRYLYFDDFTCDLFSAYKSMITAWMRSMNVKNRLKI